MPPDCAPMNSIDSVRLDFSTESLWVLNTALAFLMFSVSLFVQSEQLRALRHNPRGLAAGLASQWLVLPGLTVLVILLLQPSPGFALGMLMVAACPGGNVSNFLSMLARANVPLAISLVVISTLAAAVATPLLFTLTARLSGAADAQPELRVDLADMLTSVLLIVGLPLALGRLLKHHAPELALRIRKPLRNTAGLLMLGLILAGLFKNFGLLSPALLPVFGWVALMNALGLLGGYLTGALLRLPEADRRAISIESGIHNSGLGLVLILTFFDGAGAMAVIVAWWSVWHLITGTALALLWSRLPPRDIAERG